MLKGSGDDEASENTSEKPGVRKVVRPEPKVVKDSESAQPEEKEPEDEESAQPEEKELEGEEIDQSDANEIEASENVQLEMNETEVSDNAQTEAEEFEGAEPTEFAESVSEESEVAEPADSENAPTEDDFDNSTDPLAKTDDVLDNTTDTIVAEANKISDDNIESDDIKEVSFDTEKPSKEKAPARFVPEGMVVPMDTEEDDETPRPGRADILERRRNMAKMQSPSGKLKVGRKVIVNREFDLDATDGDDFDLF